MSYGLRTDAVLTRDGRDIMDHVAYRTLDAVGSGGVKAAAMAMGVNESTIYRRLRALDQASGGSAYFDGSLTSFGRELLEQMERHERLLKEQLEHLWKKPTLTCDGVLVQDGNLLLVRRGRDPCKGKYALPGGIVEYGERVEDCVMREVKEETGVRSVVNRLVGVFSDPGRDPRGHFVTLLFELKMTGGSLAGGDDAESANFFPLDRLPPMAFDHALMVELALSARPEHNL
jgi:8-oxo-dGTP diphosphatase